MPVLFSNTAESLGPSLYASAASRYILRAMRMSPRISAEMIGGGFCGWATTDCSALGSSRKLLGVAGLDCEATAGVAGAAPRVSANKNTETIVGLLRETIGCVG